ncbi:hypothetical protein MF672_016795 [Actinomadura sp. ATCC 31491]|uniref:GYD domain-containing protein n=1 Tax=Actinomadura luzonensis TaxID=2805427 RepID=A0ABT0FSX7_9ACTN|nr:hypothetical protein [Actinomadura luzonensis]MCK2215435.1 hypothetical protein [Actinomadura luzonensis]
MQLVVLGTATDEACLTEAEEGERFAALTERLRARAVTVRHAWNLLGRHDYLLVLDVEGGPPEAFAAMSIIAQSGAMRTESFLALPLETYFDLAAQVARP